jgi:hypothetical protein
MITLAIAGSGFLLWGTIWIALHRRLRLRFRYSGQPWHEKGRWLTPREILLAGISVDLFGAIMLLCYAASL